MEALEKLSGAGIEKERDRVSGFSPTSSAATAQNEKRGSNVFMGYTLTGPTLEEVFMNVVRESKASDGSPGEL
jgi:hypothetical protein